MPDRDSSRLEALFHAALEHGGVDRDEFLGRECAADPELIPIVREMLEGESRTRDASAWARPEWEAAGLRFGPYRVTGRIGCGGMGVVYEAIRDDDEFHKRVAIKTISPALLTDYMARKLRAERQILAQLEHPHIARLLDGGTTADGLPYVVMEYIEGEPVTRYAESRRLGTDARLGLFLDICAAVDFAHTNLVVHADLKPGNILVTEEGVAKLLDFGLARLIGASDATVAPALTPRYASPEQLSGAPLTTASDVYSLGVLLSELTAERARGTDLDTIVAMATRTEPEQRYHSVAALAEDIRRYVDHYPVRARHGSWLYGARKYARRHWAALGGAVLLTGAVTAGVVANENAARRTRLQFEQTTALAHSLLFDTYDAIAEVPGATLARRSVVELANRHLDRLAKDANADLGLRQDLAVSYRRLGEIRGAPYRANLGDTKGALENLRRAETLLEGCLRERPEDPSIGFELAKTDNDAGAILVREGDPYTAEQRQIEGLRRLEALVARDSGNLEYRVQLADAELYLGQARYIQAKRESNREKAEAALVEYEKAAGLAEALLAARPNDADAIFRLGRNVAYLGYAHWLLDDLGAPGEHRLSALACHRREVELMSDAAARQPQHARYVRGVKDAEGSLANSLWRTGQRRPALEAARRLATAGEARAAAEPANHEAQYDYAQQCDTYAQWLLESDNSELAKEWTRRAVAIYERLQAGDPVNEEFATALIDIRNAWGDYYVRRKEMRAALSEYEAGLRVARRLHSATAARLQEGQQRKIAAATAVR